MVTIRQAQSEEELAAAADLIRAFVAWSRQTYADYLDAIDQYIAAVEAQLAALPGPYAPPGGCLLLASVDGSPAGVVAFQDLGEGVCEMKRMFVDPRFQGRGIGRALGERLIAEARAAGFERMWLETGPRQLAAQSLYRRLGFRPIDPYYELPADIPEEVRQALHFMELHL